MGGKGRQEGRSEGGREKVNVSTRMRMGLKIIGRRESRREDYNCIKGIGWEREVGEGGMTVWEGASDGGKERD